MEPPVCSDRRHNLKLGFEDQARFSHTPGRRRRRGAERRPLAASVRRFRLIETMNHEALLPAHGLSYELRFPSNFLDGRCLSFPCDADGDVGLARMADRLRQSYFFAWSEVGREFGWPRVLAREALASPRERALPMNPPQSALPA
jgi:hypothetical protein